ncbi:hypothetical protein OB905_05515 [Halobacteria archaeon AArc-dxtr1]|nr:hypothetical protein [Halobacteria archaeon AArc-dxtr1]
MPLEPTHLLSRLGLERRDGRNLLLATGIMTVLLFSVIDGPTAERVLVAAIGGGASALSFLVVTVAIKRYVPYAW